VKCVSKGKLKARMLEFFRDVEASGEPLIVTDRGREVLVIQPIAGAPAGSSSAGMILSEPATMVSPKKPQVSEESLLEELRMLATPVVPISESELMAPLPLADWEVEREDDRNPWS
jgi:antitoxin (DNA-binding transcriptional repressor) of toxin-antitoxin stability system